MVNSSNICVKEKHKNQQTTTNHNRHFVTYVYRPIMKNVYWYCASLFSNDITKNYHKSIIKIKNQNKLTHSHKNESLYVQYYALQIRRCNISVNETILHPSRNVYKVI